MWIRVMGAVAVTLLILMLVAGTATIGVDAQGQVEAFNQVRDMGLTAEGTLVLQRVPCWEAGPNSTGTEVWCQENRPYRQVFGVEEGKIVLLETIHPTIIPRRDEQVVWP